MRGMNDRAAISTQINQIIESPSKKSTKQEAVKMLRSCGILNKNNKLNPAYKEILRREDEEKWQNK